MAFFPHTDGASTAFTPLPMVAASAVLDNIVADLSAAVASGTANGWSLYDDLRTGSIYTIPKTSYSGTAQCTVTSGSAGINGSTNCVSFARYFSPGLTQVSFNSGTNWYTIAAVITDSSASMTTNFGQTTSTSATFVVQLSGTVVLQCSSSQKTFYVQMARPQTAGNILYLRTLDTWDTGTHSGTNPSNWELLPAVSASSSGSGSYQFGLSGSVQYCLFLLPNVFALWAGPDPSTSGAIYYHTYYAGNIVPSRVNDQYALTAFCTNTEQSGWVLNGSNPNNNSPNGALQVFRNVSSVLWGAVQNLASAYVFKPRGNSYPEDPFRNLLDDSNSAQIVDVDLYQDAATTANTQGEGKRGMLRYLKVPIGNPSGQHLSTFGTASDGNTYIMLRNSYPFLTSNSANTTGTNDIFQASFLTTVGNINRQNLTNGEVVIPNAGGSGLLYRFFMLPINL